ncbi:hypothetical protein DLAC_10942 [Tieghemostelium lacteum]|uniref:EGF-like domain-containing protein n=1 Tax=Tieghemostelium lacteum TaxID=361077 RepID=A0A151Z2R9_TIELA|nr:hypothetical protein DLAC_10942 [Tieghemostelium lacteum]|eukprot:KYQ88250.1 hypothetical protein DLAC_10942 [Tieghemostelium lacteum]
MGPTTYNCYLIALLLFFIKFINCIDFSISINSSLQPFNYYTPITGISYLLLNIKFTSAPDLTSIVLIDGGNQILYTFAPLTTDLVQSFTFPVLGSVLTSTSISPPPYNIKVSLTNGTVDQRQWNFTSPYWTGSTPLQTMTDYSTSEIPILTAIPGISTLATCELIKTVQPTIPNYYDFYALKVTMGYQPLQYVSNNPPKFITKVSYTTTVYPPIQIEDFLQLQALQLLDTYACDFPSFSLDVGKMNGLLFLPNMSKAFLVITPTSLIGGLSYKYSDPSTSLEQVSDASRYLVSSVDRVYFIPLYKPLQESTGSSIYSTINVIGQTYGRNSASGPCTFPTVTGTNINVTLIATKSYANIPKFSKLAFKNFHIIRISKEFQPSADIIDYLILYSASGDPISQKFIVIKSLDTYDFIVDANTPLDSFQLRAYMKCGSYLQDDLTNSQTIEEYTSESVLDSQGYCINFGVENSFTVVINSTGLFEVPSIVVSTKNSPLNTPYEFLPIKSIEYDFPFRHRQYMFNYMYSPQIPNPSDTPTTFFQNYVGNETLTYSANGAYSCGDEIDAIITKYDLIHPIVFITVTYDVPVPGGTIDKIMVSLNDVVGINYEKCMGSYGPYIFNITTESRIAGGPTGVSQYFVPLQLNPYFCNADILFYCEDIRGNYIDLKKSDMDEFPSILSQFMDLPACDRGMDIFLVSIDVNFQNSQYNIYVTVYGTQDPLNATLYLVNGNKVQNLSLTIPTINAYNYRILSASIEPPSKTTLYKFEITFFDENSNEVHLNNNEIQYISNGKFDSELLAREIVSDQNLVYEFQWSGLVNSNYTLTINFPNQVSLSKLVIKLKNSMLPYIQEFQYINVTSTTVQVNIGNSANINHVVWVDSFYDSWNNCKEFTAFMYNKVIDTIPDTTIVPSGIGNRELIVTPKVIDTSLEDRNVYFRFTAKPVNWNIDSSIDPILYLVESVSLNKIKFPMKKVSNQNGVYECNIEIPVNFGSRGLSSIEIAGIVSENGFFEYISESYQLDDILKLYSSAANISKALIWEARIDHTNVNYVTITGANLNFVFASSLQVNGNYINDLTFTLVKPNLGYFHFPVPIAQVDRVSLIISGITIPINIISCMNSNCSGHGTCLTGGTCQCDANWSGLDCSISTLYTCENNCSGNGLCENMNCNCFSEYTGPNCSVKISSFKEMKINIQPNTSNPTTTFDQFTADNSMSTQSMNTKFKVLLSKVEEFDFKGTLVHSFDLINNNWNLNSSDSNNFKYEMELVKGSTIQVHVSLTGSQSKTYEFANSSLTVPPNSIKYNVKIENYNFTSTLNHLTFTWEANYQVPNPCSNHTDITYGGTNSNDVHYIMVPANQLMLYGRFSNQIIVDNRIQLSSNQAQVQNDRVLILMNTPFFRDTLEIDPDFSVLVDFNQQPDDDETEYDDECNPIDNDKSLPTYAIPVIAACAAVIGCIILVGLFTLLYTKNFRFRMAILSAKQSIRTTTKNGFSQKLSSFK